MSYTLQHTCNGLLEQKQRKKAQRERAACIIRSFDFFWLMLSGGMLA